MAENVHMELNVFRSQVELVTVHVRKDTVPKQTDLVSMLMNVLKVNTFAVTELIVSTNPVAMNVHVQTVMEVECQYSSLR